MKVERNADRALLVKGSLFTRGRTLLSFLILITFLGGFCLLVIVEAMGPPDFSKLSERSTVVLDRKGILLRAFLTDGGRWRLPVAREAVDPRFVKMLKIIEDKRFDDHWGVDPWAIMRAAAQGIVRQQIVSGASTLEMQVARLLEPREKRTFSAKFRQVVRALQLKQRFTKDEILDFYFQLAPYGGNIEGIRAASLVYFGREPERLSLAEAALLVALPQSPETRRPDRFPGAAKKARDRILERVAEAGLISEKDAELAKKEPIPVARRPFPMVASHLAERVVREHPDKHTHFLTLDHALQMSLEKLAQERVVRYGPQVSAAIVVIDNETGELRASVGSADYRSTLRQGAVDMTRAIRSPGSALKPFIFALAFELGLAHPETLLEDRRTRFGSYTPDNFDGDFRGVVTAREALQLSLNIPVIDLLSNIGPVSFLGRLKTAGAHIVMPDDKAPGLAVGLGGLGISLLDMTHLYTGFARGGKVFPLQIYRDEPTPEHPKVIAEPVPAWYIWDILKNALPPEGALGGRIAFKTGTSYGYRDAVAVGFDKRFTVGVWVGRPDGIPVPDILGRTTAAPILFEVFERIGGMPVAPEKPKNVIQVASAAQLPPPLIHTRKDIAKQVKLASQQSLKIIYPVEGTTVDLGLSDPDTPKENLLLKAQGGVMPLRWLVNGKIIGKPNMAREAQWIPDGMGFVRISVMDAEGAMASIVVRVE